MRSFAEREARKQIPFRLNRNLLYQFMSGRIFFGEPVSTSPENAPATPQRVSVDALTVERTKKDRAAIAILNDLSLTLAPGATAAITGASGAGKTTLLHALAGLRRPDRGTIHWGDQNIWAWPERQRDRWRRDAVGFVFQDFQLFPELGVLDNILLPTRFDHWRAPQSLRERARALAEQAGIAALTARAGSLSRGEQQRVAVARALIRHPALLLADEPTASLDRENGTRVTDLLLGLAQKAGASVLVVTHDSAVLGRVGTVYRLEAGRLVGAPEAAP
jgi:ABC-type lipoprotein export system ATPase subunit